MIKTLYKIPAPDSLGAQIEVYGEPENAWYEWRVIDGDGDRPRSRPRGREIESFRCQSSRGMMAPAER